MFNTIVKPMQTLVADRLVKPAQQVVEARLLHPLKSHIGDPVGHGVNQGVNWALRNPRITTAVTTAFATEGAIRLTGATPVQSGLHGLMAGTGAYAGTGATLAEAQSNLARWGASALQNTASTLAKVSEALPIVTTPLGAVLPAWAATSPLVEVGGAMIGGASGFLAPTIAAQKFREMAETLPAYLSKRLQEAVVPELRVAEKAEATLKHLPEQISDVVDQTAKQLRELQGGTLGTNEAAARAFVNNPTFAPSALANLHSRRSHQLQAEAKEWYSSAYRPELFDVAVPQDTLDANWLSLSQLMQKEQPELYTLFKQNQTRQFAGDASLKADVPTYLSQLKQTVDALPQHYTHLLNQRNAGKALPDQVTALLDDKHVTEIPLTHLKTLIQKYDGLVKQQQTAPQVLAKAKDALAQAEQVVRFTNAEAAAHLADGVKMQSSNEVAPVFKALDYLGILPPLERIEAQVLDQPFVKTFFAGNPRFDTVAKRLNAFDTEVKTLALAPEMPSGALLTPQTMLKNENNYYLPKPSEEAKEAYELKRQQAEKKSRFDRVLDAALDFKRPEVLPLTPIDEDAYWAEQLKTMGSNTLTRLQNTWRRTPVALPEPPEAPIQNALTHVAESGERARTLLNQPFEQTELGKLIGNSYTFPAKPISWTEKRMEKLKTFNTFIKDNQDNESSVIEGIKWLLKDGTISIDAVKGLAKGQYKLRLNSVLGENGVTEAQNALDTINAALAKSGATNLNLA